ncbi:hypothetical protein SYNTR_1090 [Candidatus Syntrophocurvum alkaliphilum]|uniref:Zinc finger DksA/TraR C4-type domain-containing protein n=1 Tax=Candidatus Syntrophocurvum alkaliphilum TaxID=2293317 RepID=A0A6I6DHB5_9FIRM|nr:TraR/DksA C4-type zinc finger protein [Candidatus Syntrophocurvum alkaliphilum]QGT99683.1 hypothetical protein SYNTR_1090 [Candidatus Syntrophocurvum alkaliphilum]
MDYKTNLLNKKQQLEQLIKQKHEDLMIPVSENTNELSIYDQHTADMATELFEREKDSGLLEMLEIELEKVDDALARANSGNYGVCELCGHQIEQRRLERAVNTTLCINCAYKTQDKFTRPAEEDITQSGAMSDRGETFQISGYEFYEE